MPFRRDVPHTTLEVLRSCWFYSFSDLIEARFAYCSLAWSERLFLGNTLGRCPRRCACLGQLPTFFGDGPVFLSPNHQDAHTGICRRDIPIEKRSCIRFTIEPEAEKLQSVASRGSHIGGVLAHPGGKHQNVHSAQNSGHATDRCSQTVDINVECQLRSLVTLSDAGKDVAHVA